MILFIVLWYPALVPVGSMSPLQWSIYTHAVAKVLDEKYETIWEGSSKKENVLIMTPEEITEIKQHAEAIAAILYAQTNAEQSILDFRFWILD